MNPKERNIILVGFMGTGKSTVGVMLAEMLGFSFIDTDAQVVKKAGCSIPEIFAEHGEVYFRQIEHEVIAGVLQGKGQVISTGGGAVLREDNRQAMLGNGQVIALTADMDIIVERVRQDRNRPLLQGDVEERVSQLLEQRKHAYDFADLMIDTTELTVDTIVGIILAHRPHSL